MAFSARVTPREDSDDEKNFLKVFDKLACNHIVTREFGKDGTNMHLHAVLWSHKTPKQVRAAFHGAMGQKLGNGVFSLKQTKDEDAACRYILKGDSEHPMPKGHPPNVVSFMGFTREQIDEFHAAYWEQSKKVKDNKSLKFYLQVEHYMKQNQIDFTSDNVMEAVFNLTLTEKTMFNETYMMSVAKFVLARNDKKWAKEKLERMKWALKS